MTPEREPTKIPWFKSQTAIKAAAAPATAEKSSPKRRPCTLISRPTGRMFSQLQGERKGRLPILGVSMAVAAIRPPRLRRALLRRNTALCGGENVPCPKIPIA
ncbi:hypothetical protein GCM10010987_26210 [Bradyrhizobium guangdongense]|uniref:Uncharacterized protein n=1 Tax=Bradyrhizobium guangdongense TaxID=1325090 RepID=A0AA87W6T3_9BRAD|nr:hypothetical protein GCM10010987_26210 [Bradyrhizobium guangdongense]